MVSCWVRYQIVVFRVSLRVPGTKDGRVEATHNDARCSVTDGRCTGQRGRMIDDRAGLLAWRCPLSADQQMPTTAAPLKRPAPAPSLLALPAAAFPRRLADPSSLVIPIVQQNVDRARSPSINYSCSRRISETPQEQNRPFFHAGKWKQKLCSNGCYSIFIKKLKILLLYVASFYFLFFVYIYLSVCLSVCLSVVFTVYCVLYLCSASVVI